LNATIPASIGILPQAARTALRRSWPQAGTGRRTPWPAPLTEPAGRLPSQGQFSVPWIL